MEPENLYTAAECQDEPALEKQPEEAVEAMETLFLENSPKETIESLDTLFLYEEEEEEEGMSLFPNEK